MKVRYEVQEIESWNMINKTCGGEKETINNALTLLQWAIEVVKSGRQVVSLDIKNKEYEVLHMPLFNKIKSIED